ncbi:MAG: hypothetical protein ACK5F0_00030 [Flavobacteriales bacterium]|jgi:hypothetical protein
MSAHPRDEAIAFENAFETASEYVDRMMTTEGTMSMAAEFYYDAFYTDWARELDSAAFYHYPAEMSAEEFGFVVFSASVRWWLWNEPRDEREDEWLWDGMEPTERAKWVDAVGHLYALAHLYKESR